MSDNDAFAGSRDGDGDDGAKGDAGTPRSMSGGKDPDGMAAAVSPLGGSFESTLEDALRFPAETAGNLRLIGVADTDIEAFLNDVHLVAQRRGALAEAERLDEARPVDNPFSGPGWSNWSQTGMVSPPQAFPELTGRARTKLFEQVGHARSIFERLMSKAGDWRHVPGSGDTEKFNLPLYVIAVSAGVPSEVVQTCEWSSSIKTGGGLEVSVGVLSGSAAKGRVRIMAKEETVKAGESKAFFVLATIETQLWQRYDNGRPTEQYARRLQDLMTFNEVLGTETIAMPEPGSRRQRGITRSSGSSNTDEWSDEWNEASEASLSVGFPITIGEFGGSDGVAVSLKASVSIEKGWSASHEIVSTTNLEVMDVRGIPGTYTRLESDGRL